METLQTILIFFSQTLIVVAAAAALLLLIGAVIAKAKIQKTFDIEMLHEKYEDQTQALKESLLNDSELKAERKRRKKEEKEKAEKGLQAQQSVFVLDFLKGDIKASDTEHLREEISTLLGVATAKDEASILSAVQAIRYPPLASPFALIGSIGVVAQVPNFNKLLKKYDVDYKEYTAGDYKRTVSLFGEITEKGEIKFKEQLEATHVLFKSFVAKYRPQLELAKVATGEFWYGEQALALNLVDEIRTSDDYLLSKRHTHRIIRLSFEQKPSFSDKISDALARSLSLALDKFIQQNPAEKRL